MLGRDDLIRFGLELVEGCHATYAATATRIGPELFGWDSSQVPDDQKAFYQENGFYIRSSGYNLRPEVIESYYYAYRATSNQKVGFFFFIFVSHNLVFALCHLNNKSEQQK